jgi:hypothetical protein
MPQLLTSSVLGRHTGVIHINGSGKEDGQWSASIKEYIWSNPTLRPHGEFLPLLCPQCSSYRTWELQGHKTHKTNKGDLTFVCKARNHLEGSNCGYRLTIPPRSDITHIRSPPSDTWLVKVTAM